MLKRVWAIPLVLRVGLAGLFLTATLHGQEAQVISPTNSLQNAWDAFASNRYVEADFYFHAAVMAEPGNAEAYAGRGRSQYNLKDYPGAIKSLERALALQPGHANWMLFLGESYWMGGENSKAANLLQKYVSLRTNSVEGYKWLSHVLFKTAQYDAAASAARRVIGLDPTNNFGYRQLGLCLARLNRHEDAIVAFRQATVIDPKDWEAYLECGLSMAELGRLDEATTSIEKACENKKRNLAERCLLFGLYLGTFQVGKAWQLFPWVFAVGGGVFMLV